MTDEGAPQHFLYLSLHTHSPDENEILTTPTVHYARKAVTWAAASTSGSAAEIPIPPTTYYRIVVLAGPRRQPRPWKVHTPGRYRQRRR